MIFTLLLVLLSPAIALPSFVDRLVRRPSREAADKRANYLELAQFQFQPFLLRNVCLDCRREAPDVMFQCSIKCKSFSPPWFFSILSC